MSIFQILHVVGVILGFGGAAVSVAIMLDVRTDEKRLHRGRIARRICIVTWSGLALLIISGIALAADYNNGYNIVLAIKHLFVIIIVVDAIIIHFRLFPRYFRQIGTPDFDVTYRTMRRIGMLSTSSWICTLILSAFL